MVIGYRRRRRPRSSSRDTQPISIVSTTACAFPIAVNVVDTVTGRIFVDTQGNFQGIDLEQNIVGTDGANGISLPRKATTSCNSPIS
jgi:hypothetical protein